MDTAEALCISCGFEGCSKIFTKRMDYNRHRKSHERPYKCSICDKSFGLKTDRDRHRTTHKPNAPKFMCNFPGCKFKGTPRKDYLLKHIRNCHKSSGDSASRESVPLYYQKSANEATEFQSEETLLGFLDAVGQGDECLVKSFISAKIDLCGKDSRGITAGDIAATKGHSNILRLLIEAGIDVNTNQDEPWIHQAIKNGHLDSARLLLGAGAKVGLDPFLGYGPSSVFEEALMKGCHDAITLVQQHRADTHARPVLEQLLGEAMQHGDLSRTLQLFKMGAPLSLSETALEYGVRNGLSHLVGLLLDNGAQFPPSRASTTCGLSFVYATNSKNIAMAHLIAERVCKISDPDSWEITIRMGLPTSHTGHSGLQFRRILYSNEGSARQLSIPFGALLCGTLVKALVDLGAYDERVGENGPIIARYSTVSHSQYCLDQWNDQVAHYLNDERRVDDNGPIIARYFTVSHSQYCLDQWNDQVVHHLNDERRVKVFMEMVKICSEKGMVLTNEEWLEFDPEIQTLFTSPC
ncbi:uncharacterized protein PAC_15702 [Phialocephala subalpina]|uniref:C2H2-type domain-containing protein n=1 Tax=Phialocephala subalpina TaxID=576137 RepID=A0A1L7XL88_9HELO|nr:uncharacterized protein PAC_15702 [Phialocephala subalpina]